MFELSLTGTTLMVHRIGKLKAIKQQADYT